MRTQKRPLTEQEQDDRYEFEERAAILEYEAGMPRHIAEATARRMIAHRKERERLERGHSDE